MRVGISGTHGTGKTTLAEALCAHLPGYVTADEPYYLLEEEGHEFGFPPSAEDYRALLARSLRSLSPPLLPAVIFDRTPLDYLAYLAATGADPCDEAGAAALRPAFARLDLLVITLITSETERVLPAAEMPGLRSQVNDALLELVYDDPLNAWDDIPVLEPPARSTAGWTRSPCWDSPGNLARRNQAPGKSPITPRPLAACWYVFLNKRDLYLLPENPF